MRVKDALFPESHNGGQELETSDLESGHETVPWTIGGWVTAVPAVLAAIVRGFAGKDQSCAAIERPPEVGEAQQIPDEQSESLGGDS